MHLRVRQTLSASLTIAAAGLVSGGTSLRAQTPPAEPLPYTIPALTAASSTGEQVPADPTPAVTPLDATAASASRHEALQSSRAIDPQPRAPKSPPRPRAETPTDDRPNAEAVWAPGYWDWSAGLGDFDWVPGAWVMPPARGFWVEGRWMRDADGWYRIRGSWSYSPKIDPVTAPTPAALPAAQNWRTDGPPASPEDLVGPAPAADYFFIPGRYVPEGDRLNWSAGYWAKLQPGWDWVPARWVRRPDGWDYREGYWASDPSTAPAPVRRSLARPRIGSPVVDLPPAIVDARPGPDLLNGGRVQGPLTPAVDPIDELEIPPVGPPAVIVPRGNPYLPPGYYVRRPPYYSPRASIPDEYLPPFLRRFLDRVVP